jgi:hypothetical protein
VDTLGDPEYNFVTNDKIVKFEIVKHIHYNCLRVTNIDLTFTMHGQTFIVVLFVMLIKDPAHGEVYSIQPFSVTCERSVVFSWFPPPIKLTA